MEWLRRLFGRGTTEEAAGAAGDPPPDTVTDKLALRKQDRERRIRLLEAAADLLPSRNLPRDTLGGPHERRHD